MASARLFTALAVAALALAAGAARKADKWSKVNWDAVEKQLEEGDDAELLITEDAIKIKEMERRRGLPLERPPEAGDADPADHLKHSQAAAGPTMMFASLKPTQADGKPWTKEAIEELVFKWKELLKTGGIEVEAYDLGGGDGEDVAVHDHHKPRSKDAGEREHNHDEDDRRLLVTLHEGWRGYQLKSFFMTQTDIVHQVEWDGVKYPTDPSERANASPPPHNHKGHKAAKSLHARHHKHHVHANHEEDYHDHPHDDASSGGRSREYIRNGVDDDGVVTINGQRLASGEGGDDAAVSAPPPSEDEASASAAQKARAKRAGPNIPNSNVAHGVHSILKAQGKSVKFAGDGDHHIDDVLKHGAVKVGGARASLQVNVGGGVEESEVVPEAYRRMEL